MIKTLIFDFGDVFINLDKQGAWNNALRLFKMDAFSEDMLRANEDYEQGFITTDAFLNFYLKTFSYLSKDHIIDAWNFIIKDFPEHRFYWIKELAESKNYKLLLLSNTNDLHIEFIKSNVSFYEDFKSCFDVFYLSQEIGFRKPNTDIFEFVLKENNLQPNECIFIDDTIENTDTASKLGFHVWNIDEANEDVTDLFTIKSHLF